MGIERQTKLPEGCALQVAPLTPGGAHLQHVVRQLFHSDAENSTPQNQQSGNGGGVGCGGHLIHLKLNSIFFYCFVSS